MNTSSKPRCQSCGMPVGEGFYGTNADGTPMVEYCLYCFKGGAFVQPSLTVDRMIQLSIDQMINELKMPEKDARRLAVSVIPSLKRWSGA